MPIDVTILPWLVRFIKSWSVTINSFFRQSNRIECPMPSSSITSNLSHTLLKISQLWRHPLPCKSSIPFNVWLRWMTMEIRRWVYIHCRSWLDVLTYRSWSFVQNDHGLIRQWYYLQLDVAAMPSSLHNQRTKSALEIIELISKVGGTLSCFNRSLIVSVLF